MKNIKVISALCINLFYWLFFILLPGIEFVQYFKLCLCVITLASMILIWICEIEGYDLWGIGFFLYTIGFGVLFTTIFCIIGEITGDESSMVGALFFAMAEGWILLHVFLGGGIVHTIGKAKWEGYVADRQIYNAKLSAFLFLAAFVFAIDLFLFSL